MTAPVLSVAGLSVGFTQRGREHLAVEGLDLAVARGEVVGLVGESGSGKSVTGLALMGLIFFLSAQSHLSSGLGVWDLIGRKIVHATEYGLLFTLWWRALGWRSPQAPLIAAAIAIGYSATDEFHQSFVPGR